MGRTVIPSRPFGGTGLQVSALGMGCAALGAFWQGRSVAQGRRALEEALDHGITFFDTADRYARGISERLVGRVVRSSTQHPVVCTKVGFLKTPVALVAAQRSGGGPGGSLAGWRRAAQGMARESSAVQCFTSAYVEQAAHRSLRRMGSERLDVLLLHSPPLAVVEAAAFLDGVARLRQAGEVGVFGISCTTPEVALAALAIPQVACLELPYNPRTALDFAPALSEAAARGVPVVARSVFAAGDLLDPARGGGAAKECLQFALGATGITVALAGMSRPEHVRANAALVGVDGC